MPAFEITESTRGLLLILEMAGAATALALSFRSLKLAKELKKKQDDGWAPNKEAAQALATTIKISIGCALAVAACMSLSGDIWGTTAWTAFTLFQYRNLSRTKIKSPDA